MNLEKRNAKKKNIHKLKQGDNIFTDQTSVLKEVVNFYQDLYSSKSVDADSLNNYFEKVQVPTLSDED